jgi:ATP-dependent helicase YprA (DUF1998 family)
MDSLTTRFEKEVFEPYCDLLKSEYRFHPAFDYAKQMWEEKLTMEELVNGPFLEKSQAYEQGDDVNKLPLHEKTKETIRQRLKGRNLYRHQTEALKLLLNDKNAVIATGTSSGKTLCYQIPILDDLLCDSSKGLRAIIIYPLNALVNDQLNEWEEMLIAHPQITFARFTGQTPNNETDYRKREEEIILERLLDEPLKDEERKREAQRRLHEKLDKDPKNRLNHREAIRANPPHILVTNFSMLEYLLERPVDTPIFENARLKFLVLDEVHAYRGVQATEIAFLVRRLKDRLSVENLTCIATSATLGKPNDKDSKAKVRKFASDLFDGAFEEPNPIYGTAAKPQLSQPSFKPSSSQYIEAANALRNNDETSAKEILSSENASKPLADLLRQDENLYLLRKEILVKPIKLEDAAKQLWSNDEKAQEGLQALLEIVASIKSDNANDDLLPTRLHYFFRAQDGLHVCLHTACPDRQNGKPAFFVSRKNGDAKEGSCPSCAKINQTSLLVEVVTCRKCGYLFGALQDLGPRRAQSADEEDNDKAAFDSFSTELGWSADSFWSYFSVDGDLPYPSKLKVDEDEEEKDTTKLLLNPAELKWCVICGKKSDKGAGDNCKCGNPHLKAIKVFHRQCPTSGKARDVDNLYNQEKKRLTACPNCGARNASGLEPVRRFQESDDETGLAMAVPLSHFQVSEHKGEGKPPRKLLCFTDHRQRAAAFPALLEEETFAHDMGRKIFQIVRDEKKPIELLELGERLAEIADLHSDKHDSDFFLPASRLPDGNLTAKEKQNLWLAETFSYFGIPDSARESVEDLGLVAIEYQVRESELEDFHTLLDVPNFSLNDSSAVLQTLLGFIRQRKAFTLPKGRVNYDDVAFGRVGVELSFALRKDGQKKVTGWLPKLNKDGSYRDNFVTDYLHRLLKRTPNETLELAEKIWNFLTSQFLLLGKGDKYKVDYERMLATTLFNRFVCCRCGYVTAYSALGCCSKKECDGRLEVKPFDATKENMIARWVAGVGEAQFTTLKSEEHTAQVNKDFAKRIEEEFRAEGVNLLSSTTTFEMGINIGDLQKVLLRNAPPTSASYVQRVGRAGRGNDKNSVCVTLCKRTKYDADAWKYPADRLMSGEIRTPTVFTSNRIIAQRHFNAVIFAQFLREKIRDEKLLREINQKTSLAPFLPVDIRSDIRADWMNLPSPDIYLDFTKWLEEQSESNIFKTNAKLDLLSAVIDFEVGKRKALNSYQKILGDIADKELLVLYKEMKRLGNEQNYKAADEVGRSVKNLLNEDIIAVLAKRGFLPRYAFPLDTVTLETGFSRWSSDSDVELSRDRAIAIAEFAPRAQVVARKKVFTSAGLYAISNRDIPSIEYFSQCPDCKQIRTAPTQDELLRLGQCEVCQRTITRQHTTAFVQPIAFSIRIDKNETRGERHRRTSFIRQRQSVTHFIDIVEESEFEDFGLFRVALKNSGNLFRYNLGFNNKGFVLCPSCGYSEQKKFFKADKKHQRLRALGNINECSRENLKGKNKGIAYGHKFESFCLVARPARITANINDRSFISLAYALQRGLCRVLDIETSDIGVSGRGVTTRRSVIDSNVEIVLFDKTPGGAGFVKEGFENWEQVVQEAYKVCDECNCESACYDCLKDYYNQSAHEHLNRKAVIEYIEPVIVAATEA